MNTLILDNYDSFTYNLYQYIAELGGNPKVHRNDAISIDEFDAYSHIIISPGPGNPYTKRDIGISEELIDFAVENSVPLLGICLGHQTIGKHFGSRVFKAPEAFHGKASTITIDTESKLFKELEDSIEVMRYHSLIIESVPENFKSTATTVDGIVMAMEHDRLPLYGIQFHPESIGTPVGKLILQNFLSVIHA